MVTGGADSLVKVWNTKKWTIRATLQSHSFTVTSANFHSSGQTLVTTSMDQKIVIWMLDVMMREKMFVGHKMAIHSVVYHPSDLFLLTASEDFTLKMWDISLETEVKPPEGTEQRILYDEVQERKRAKEARLRRRDDKLIEIEYEEEVEGLQDPHSGYIRTIAFDSTGLKMASGADDGKVKVWDAVSAAVVSNLVGHDGSVQCVAWSKDGCEVFSGSADCTIIVWDVLNQIKKATIISHQGPVNALQMHPDGTILASASDDSLACLWNVANVLAEANTTPTLIAKNSIVELCHDRGFSVNDLAFPKGVNVSTLLTACEDTKIRLWDIRDGEVKMTFQGHLEPVHAITFDRKGEKIASTMGDFSIKIWDVGSGNCVGNWPIVHKQRINDLTMSEDGVIMISASDDQTIKIWDNASGKVQYDIDGDFGKPKCAVYNPNGSVLAIGAGSSIFTYMGTVDHSIPNMNSHMRVD